MTTQHLAAQVGQLATLAERNKNNGCYDTARIAMWQAQNVWTPALGTPRPDFTGEGWTELDLRQMEEMIDLAERNAIAGRVSEATASLETSRISWARLEEPRPPRPRLSRESRGAISRATAQDEDWTAAHLSIQHEHEFRCPICIEDLSMTPYMHDSCKNIFCCECLDTWMSLSRACPLCRQDM